MSRTSRSNRRWTAVMILLFLACGMAGCVTNPATGRRQFNALSTEEEIALGEEAMPELTREYGGEADDPVLTRYVSEVGGRMTPHTEADNPSLPWEFTLLDSDVINAFALPGGKVFLTRELMSRMTNEAQLAGVLGHEIGHVTAQHVDDRLGQAMIVSGLATAAGLGARQSESNWAKVIPLIVGVGGQGYLLKYGRGQELEADQLGMRYMTRAGYDPRGMEQVMQILEASQAEAGGGPPEWLSTHPYPETRIEQIRDLLRREYRDTQNNPNYNLHDERFERVVGSRFSREQRLPIGDRLAALSGPLDPPSSWCVHCRLAAGELESH